jgi:hypothetical protein
MPHRFEQLSPLVYLVEAALLGLAPALGLTEEQVDQMFIQAATLEA